jgi:linoleoyl-CoA desaturase
MKQVSFGHDHQDFWKTLKDEVNLYFKKTNKEKTGNGVLYFKTGLFLTGFVATYLVLMMVEMPVVPSLLMCGLLGFFGASIGFNIMHDACHGSYSNKKWVNEIVGLSMNLIGSNAFLWKQKHNVIHHTYTNIDGVDDDIQKSPLLRHCKTQVWKPAHRFQHIYMFFLYGVSSIFWAFVTDVQKYFSDKIGSHKRWKMPIHEHFIFWISKLYYVIVFCAIPIYIHGFGVWLIGYFAMNFIFGTWLSVVFQLAHVVEITEFEKPEENQTLKIDDWAVHQIRTTADFAPNNKIISFLVGGLNFQVVHHLFPHVSHVHYPAIQKIVAETCQKFGIDYHCNPTMIAALASHVKTMRILGSGE